MRGEARGMGGWLLFFTITLTVRPLLMLVTTLATLGLMSEASSTLALGLVAIVTLAVAAYTAWMAYVFWTLKPNAVRSLRAYFGVLLAYCLFAALVRLIPHYPSSEISALLDGLARSAIGGLVYVAVWTTYFTKSRRVANTFGAPVATA